MTEKTTLEDRVALHYPGLPGQLQRAADYVLSHPLDIASRSLRAISDDIDVSPATFSRLSRALGFDSFEAMKELSRRSVSAQVTSFSERAEALRQDRGGSILARQSQACISNIEAFATSVDEARLAAAAGSLRQARSVVLVGALASHGVSAYMAYLAQYFSPTWTVAEQTGGSLGAQLAALGPEDAVLIVTKAPYATRAILAAQSAAASGADVIVITDSHKCPARAVATHSFTVPTDSPQFFSSYVVTLVLIETLIAMIVSTSEADATATIQKVEAKNQDLGEYWPE